MVILNNEKSTTGGCGYGPRLQHTHMTYSAFHNFAFKYITPPCFRSAFVLCRVINSELKHVRLRESVVALLGYTLFSTLR